MEIRYFSGILAWSNQENIKLKVLETGERLGFMPRPETEEKTKFGSEILSKLKPCLHTREINEEEGTFSYAWVNQVHIYTYKKVFLTDHSYKV